jgi:hypothetical protein
MDEVAKIAKVRFLHGSRGRRSGGHKREGQCALPGEVSGGAIKLAQPKGCDDADREVSRGHSSREIDEGLNRSMNASESFESLIGQLRRKTVAAEGAGRISREVCLDGYSRPGRPTESRIQRNRRIREPYVRWCGRTVGF